MIPPPPHGPELSGPLLARLRLARGWSQAQLAARLCAAAEVATLSRHEISRWERQVRVPGDFWLDWLAVVLEVPRERLSGASAASRRADAYPVTDGSRARRAMLALAQRWLADPDGSLLPPGPPPTTHPPTTHPPTTHPPTAHLPAIATPTTRTLAAATPTIRALTGGTATINTLAGGTPTTRTLAGDTSAGDGSARVPGPAYGDHAAPDDPAEWLAGLRRLDDLSGGADLAGLGASRLRRVARGVRLAGPSGRRRLLPVLAEAAQLTGWLAADAGDPAGGLTAYRLGLRAATAAGDRMLAGHVLGSASHLLAGTGDPAGALLLARAAYTGTGPGAPAGLRAVLLHRTALAAALDGRHATAGQALTAARRVADRHDPRREPPWLYWLDPAELAAMTGRTLAALGRPLRAEPLLRAGCRPGQPRTTAVYGSWLARAYLDLGEVEQACVVAEEALLAAVRAGSVRAAGHLAEVGRRLAAQRADPAVRRHAALVTAARPYLPRRVTPPVVRGRRRRPASVDT